MLRTKKIAQEYRELFRNPEYRSSFFLGLALFVIVLGIHMYAAGYATAHLGSTASDIFLDQFAAPAITAWIYLYGTLVFLVVAVASAITWPRSLPFTFKTAAAFTIIRAGFIILTHLGFPAGMATIPHPTAFESLFFRGGLFFSGHAALPALLAFIYWDRKPLRYLFLVSTVFFSAIVLLGHLHYSIDVFAGIFIAHSIYCLSEKAFSRDFRRMNGELK